MLRVVLVMAPSFRLWAAASYRKGGIWPRRKARAPRCLFPSPGWGAGNAGNPLLEGEGRVRCRPFDTVAVTSPLPLMGLRATSPGASTSPLPLSLQERGSPRLRLARLSF